MEINQIFEGIAKGLQESCKPDYSEIYKGMTIEELKTAEYSISAETISIFLNCDIDQVPDIDIGRYESGRVATGQSYSLEVDNQDFTEEELLKEMAKSILNSDDVAQSWQKIAYKYV